MQNRPTRIFFAKIHSIKLSPGEKESSYANVVQFMMKCPTNLDESDLQEPPSEQGAA